MLDPQLLREQPDDVRARLQSRGVDAEPIDTLLGLEPGRGEILPLLETARKERKELGGKIAKAKKEGLPAATGRASRSTFTR